MTDIDPTQRCLIIGDSGGIGAALAARLRGQNADVVGVSRSRDGFDMRDPVSVAHHLGRLTGPFDLVLITTGILAAPGHRPEKSLAAIQPEAMAEVMAINTIGVALVLQQVPRLLPRNRRSVVGALTARVGSIGDNRAGGWFSYRASKAAANQIVRSAAIEISRKHKQTCVVALHPGTVDTAFTAAYPAHEKQSPDEAAARLLGVIANLGPEQNGQFFDWAGQPVPW